MGYIKIRFNDEFNRLGSNLEKTIEDIFEAAGPMFSLSERSWHPQMDIYETPQEIIIKAEIAGVDKDQLEVEITSKAVKIYGTRSETPLERDATYRLAEIQYGRFERILYLPALIDPEKVTTSYKNGFLVIRLAKLPVDQTHSIPIEDG